MDVKISKAPAWFLSLALVFSLNVSPLAMADGETAPESEASEPAASSAIFITDDSSSEPPALPSSAEGSIVFVGDAPAESPLVLTNPAAEISITSEPVQNAPGSELTSNAIPDGELHVASDATSASPTVLRPIAKQQSLMPIVEQPLITQATIRADVSEPVEVPVEQEQPNNIQVDVSPETYVTDQFDQQLGPQSLEELLIAAHQISQQAETVEEYSQIIDACAEAIRLGAKADQGQFARALSSWAFNRRGQLHADQGKQQQAGEDFQAALELNPRNWRALHNRGVSFAQGGQLAEAFDDFNLVTQLSPNYAKAYANRATLYVQAKDLQAAIKDYEQAIKRDEKFVSAYVGLGRVCHMLGRWDEAVDYFAVAVHLEPNSPDVVCSRGDLHADMGNYGDALADYAQAIELDPEFAHAYRNGAWLLATCPDEQYRDADNAILGAERALEYSYGDRHVSLDTLAAAYASKGEFDKAISTLTKAVDLAPENAKFAYLSRLQLYQSNEPFLTEPVGEVSQATYEVSDR